MDAPGSDAELTGAEVVAVTALALIASAVVPAYLVYRAGGRIAPGPLLLVAVLAAGLCARRLGRSATWAFPELAAFAVIVAAVCGWLVWLAWPELLPLGGGPDLTHHLVLIDYLVRHWQLVDGQALVPYLGDMIHYTPGSHLLFAMASAWTRVDALRVIHPVLALTVALKSGLVFLIARRLLPRDVPRTPFAVIAVLFLLLPLDYFIGSFTHDSYWAQVAAEVFACAMWWALVVWDRRPSWVPAALYAAAGVATFIIWPMWVGPLVVTLVAVVTIHEGMSAGRRLAHLAIALVPIALVAAIHAVGQLRWVIIATTSGAVIHPSPSAIGWGFLAPSLAGLYLAATRRRGRVTAMLVAAIALQAVTLFVLATRRGAETPYMAYKMMFLMIYPLGAAAALAVAEGCRLVARLPGWRRWLRTGPAWALATIFGMIVARHVAAAPPPAPILTQSVYAAGLWARSHVDPACVEYLVANGYTSYWLHLAVLGNSRLTPRTADNDTFEPKKAIIRSLYPGGLPFAVVDDWSALPRDLRDNLDIVARFGRSVVVKRRGLSSCS